MKKHLIALSIAAAAGTVSAQSSVTLFGIVDAALQHGSATGAGSASRTALVNSGHSTSRLGFRGTEDLGGGTYAAFWLEGQLLNDDGGAGRELAPGNQSNSPAVKGQGFNFSRRATVSVGGNWGEVRLGRDFVPTNYNWGLFDPFNNVGSGASLLITGSATGLNAGAAFRLQPAGQTTDGILVRASNIMSYFLPEHFGGVYGQASYWLGENAQVGAKNDKDGTGGGFRLGYRAGALNVAAAWMKTTYKSTPFDTAAGSPSGDLSSWNIGGAWNFGVARLMGTYSRERRDSTVPATGTGAQVAVVVPVGADEIRTAYSTYKIAAGVGAEPRAQLLAAGYVHNLSKRTNVYFTLARMRNTNGARMAIGGSTIGAGVTNASSTGVDLGIRQAF